MKMGFMIFKKLFGRIRKRDPYLERCKLAAKREGLSTYEDLVGLLQPLVRKATKLIVENSFEIPENTQMRSHFGGQPYFQENEEWPISKSGKNYDFIFQIFNNGELGLADDIKLIQFYYNFDEFPWNTESDGWLVKIYDKIHEDKSKYIPCPNGIEKPIYCDIKFAQIDSLPDWEGIDTYSKYVSNLCLVIDEESPWEIYRKACEEIIGKTSFQSQIGGYPRWVQGESTPRKQKGEPMELLFQIDSEDDAGLMWGDSGLIYVFYGNDTNNIEFSLQCY